MAPLAHDAGHSPNADQSAAIGNLRPISQSREQLDSGMVAEGVGFEQGYGTRLSNLLSPSQAKPSSVKVVASPRNQFPRSAILGAERINRAVALAPFDEKTILVGWTGRLVVVSPVLRNRIRNRCDCGRARVRAVEVAGATRDTRASARSVQRTARGGGDARCCEDLGGGAAGTWRSLVTNPPDWTGQTVKDGAA
jgi:hypothetical protein